MEYKDFVDAIQRQRYFDTKHGMIITVKFKRRFFETKNCEEKATKCAKFRVFFQREQIETKGGEKKYTDVCWAIASDLKFALDEKPFVPVQDYGKFVWDDNSYVEDMLSVRRNQDWNKIISSALYTDGSHIFVKIVSEPYDYPFDVIEEFNLF